jgi:hypothetical protein
MAKKKFLTWLDRVYYKLKRHLNPPDDVQAYADGYIFGYNAGRAAILRELHDKSLYNFSSEELRMGYDYARYVAEKVEPVCR